MRNILLVSTDDKRIKHLFHELEPIYLLDVVESIEDGIALLNSQKHLALVVDLNDFGIPDFDLLPELAAEGVVEICAVGMACEHTAQLAVCKIPAGLRVVHPSDLLRLVNQLSDAAAPELDALEA